MVELLFFILYCALIAALTWLLNLLFSVLWTWDPDIPNVKSNPWYVVRDWAKKQKE